MRYISVALFLVFILWTVVLVTPVKDPKPSDAKKARTCYFSTSKTSSFEKHKRTRSARTKSTCSDKMIDLSSLANNKDGNFFGAPHEMGIVIARHEGTFLHENSDLSQWKGTMICSHHLDELSRKYNKAVYHHQVYKDGKALCGFPEKGLKHLAVRGLELTYSQSQYLLENRNFLLHPGTPMCRKHHEEMIGMAAEAAHISNLDFEAETGADGDVVDMEVDDDEEVCDGEDEHDPDFTARVTPDPARSFFNQFAKEAGVSRARCWKPWSKITTRAKNYRASALGVLVETMAGMLADTDEGQSELKKMLVDVLEGRKAALDEDLVAHEIMVTVAEHYKKALNTHDRIWTLAPFTQLFNYPTMARYLNGLSLRMWDLATRMAIDQDSILPPTERIVERYDPVKLAFFVHFITSPHILIGLPFGSSTVKDSHGNTIHVTNAVRQTGIYETIRIYTEYMRQNGLEALLLKRTTMYNILAYLPIKKAHSLTCVNYFQADATNAFIDIGRMIDELVEMTLLDKPSAAHLKREFDGIKLYLRGNFRLHVKLESLYSDHCLLWALSDPHNPHFSTSHTGHKHAQRCPDCLAIDSVIRDMRELLIQYSSKPNLSFDEQKKLDGFLHDFDLNAQRIYDLKFHYARSVYANMNLEKLIDNTQEDQCVLTDDYAQKWEGTQFREPQSEYYGKSGVSWHMGHARCIVSGKAATHAFVHIMKESEQNSTAAAVIVEHILGELATMGIKGVHIRSDNAAYYHSSALIASMPTISKSTGVKVLSYSFSESQAGKGPADRFIGLEGTKMRGYRDKQHKVITPEEMFEAMNSTKQVRGVSIYLGTLKETKRSTTKIAKITELSHFEFHGNSARAWRFYGIGDGTTIPDLNPSEGELVLEKTGGKLPSVAVNKQDRERIKNSDGKLAGQYDEPTFWILPHERAPMFDVEPNARDDDVVTPNIPDPMSPAGASKQSLFYCPDCSASFILYSNFVKHIEKGKHFIRPEHFTLKDTVLGMFLRSIENTLKPIVLSPISEVIKASKSTISPELPQGWAIKPGRKTGRYPETTKNFIKQKFDEYARNGLKLKADEAERLMRADQYILPRDWMTKSQLRNFLRTLVDQLPKIRAWRRAVHPEKNEEEDMDDDHYEVEVEPAEEDIVLTASDFYHDLTKSKLKKLFTDVDNPPMPHTQVPDNAIDFD